MKEDEANFDLPSQNTHTHTHKTHVHANLHIKWQITFHN